MYGMGRHRQTLRVDVHEDDLAGVVDTARDPYVDAADRSGTEDHDGVAQWAALQNELNYAALARLDAYPEAVADPVRERLTRRTQPDEDEFGSAVQRAQLERFRRLRIDLINAERDALLVVRRSGSYPSAMLDRALSQLDAEQIGIELQS